MITTNRLRWRMPVLRLYTIVVAIALCCFSVSSAQNAFSLTVSKTDQSCPGNGSLSFSVQNASGATPVTYRVYRLPNTSTPIAVQSVPLVQGLYAGSYNITASQVANGATVTDSKNITIANTFIPLTYTLASQDANCGPNGKINVSVKSGTAVTYEIMNGPVTRPPQSSPNLSGLPGGTYQVRVTDNCGNGVVVTHTMFSDAPVLQVSPGSIPDAGLPACNQVRVQHTISAGSSIPIAYPLLVRWTLYPPNGDPTVTTTGTIASGSPQQVNISKVFPFYYNTNYYYDLLITDPCGNTYTSNQNLIHGIFTSGGSFAPADCGMKYLKISFDKYMPPCTISFASYPPGFDPATFNSQHPGPFAAETDYGSSSMPVPYGFYTYTATDACGHSYTQTLNHTPPVINIEGVGFNDDCATGLGTLTSRVNDFTFATATLIAAPPAYTATHVLPENVSAFIIGPDGLKIHGLPPGTYRLVFTDTCGNTYPPEDITVPIYNGGGFGGNVRPDCVPGKGTMRLTGGTVPLTAVTIESAPAGVPFTTPYNATALINADGNLYMDNLPPGDYTFKASNSCNPNMAATLSLVPYTVTDNSYAITPHCGSFDLVVTHNSTGTAFATLWLQQKLDYTSNTWGNPLDGTVYPEGTIPTAANSIAISSGVTLFNIPYIGDFRILKRYQSFDDGTEGTKDCYEVLQQFNYSGNLEITDVVSISCSGTNADVEVITNGVPPIHYTIQEKNYQPYFADNGNSPFFTNLEPAVYTFRAEDSCGRFRSRSFNVAALPSLATANASAGLHQCDTDGNGAETFSLATLSAGVLGTQTGPQHSISYHASPNEADTGTNPLPLSYSTGTAIIYARVLYTGSATTCYAVTALPLIVSPQPFLTMPGTAALCEGSSVTLQADAGYAQYQWDNGPATAAYEVQAAGTYTVTATDIFGCSSTKSVVVTSYKAPVIRVVDIKDWTTSDNVITVHLEDPASGNYHYSLDGSNYQQSPTFSGLEAGNYRVYVKDLNECGQDDAPAVVLSYPRFFTPNGDGQNETWRIRFAMAEPGLQVEVYDRFGKLLSSFGPDGGWDGTFNGTRLPATDYWFVVRRQDGRQLKGHFAMLR